MPRATHVWRSNSGFFSCHSSGNHKAIFAACGFEVKTYRYYKTETNALDYEGMLEDLKGCPKHAVVVLHTCAHNPTGVDPTPEQWSGIVAALKVGHWGGVISVSQLADI